jgi:hypothetical protein
MKVKICKVDECGKEAANFPNSTIKQKYCQEHAIKAVLDIQKQDAIKHREELERLRLMRKKGHNSLKTDHQKAIKLADDWFSRYIRFKHSFDRNGTLFCECYTCFKHYPMMAMDNGHWQKRENITTRFHPDNARPQCTECNQHKKGEYSKFEMNLISEIGTEKTEQLKYLATRQGENTTEYCKLMADKYRMMCKELFKDRGVKNPWDRN